VRRLLGVADGPEESPELVDLEQDRWLGLGRERDPSACLIARDEDRDRRYAKAAEVARYVYGADRRGRAAATNSMIHDVLNEMERVAGC
jgi:hypothetical protein